MSLLKKIFGKKDSADAKSTNGPSLVNRPPRVRVTKLHRISFQPENSNEGLGIVNISAGGMGVFHDQGSVWQPLSLIKGRIVIDKEEFEIASRIKHLSELLAGCEFQGDVGALRTLRRSIENYLRVEILALSLRRVNDAFVKPDPRGKPLWLTDGNQNELYVTSDVEGVSSFHMNFLGHYFEFDRNKGLRGGRIMDSGNERGTGYKPASLLHFHQTLPEESLSSAKIFIENLEKLPEDLRQLIQALLVNPKISLDTENE